MFRVSAACLLLIFLAACGSNTHRAENAAESRPQSAPAAKTLVEKTLDSLAGWQRFETLFYRDTAQEYAVFADNTSGDAVLCDVSGKQLTIYRKSEGRWLVDSTYAWDAYPQNIEKADLDGKGQDDIRITGFPQINGNSEIYMILAGPDGRRRYHPEWTRWNSQYDFKTGLLYCFFTGGNSANGKEMYEWKGDSLQLVEALEWNFNGFAAEPTMERYAFRRGRKIALPTPGKFSEEYVDTALFTISSLPW